MPISMGFRCTAVLCDPVSCATVEDGTYVGSPSSPTLPSPSVAVVQESCLFSPEKYHWCPVSRSSQGGRPWRMGGICFCRSFQLARWAAVCRLLSAVCCLPSAVCRLLSAVQLDLGWLINRPKRRRRKARTTQPQKPLQPRRHRADADSRHPPWLSLDVHHPCSPLVRAIHFSRPPIPTSPSRGPRMRPYVLDLACHSTSRQWSTKRAVLWHQGRS